jgi:hypothetical protein
MSRSKGGRKSPKVVLPVKAAEAKEEEREEVKKPEEPVSKPTQKVKKVGPKKVTPQKAKAPQIMPTVQPTSLSQTASAANAIHFNIFKYLFKKLFSR